MYQNCEVISFTLRAVSSLYCTLYSLSLFMIHLMFCLFLFWNFLFAFIRIDFNELRNVVRLIIFLQHFYILTILLNCFNFIFLSSRSFIPKREQPLFDISVGMNGEIMHSEKQSVDEDLLPDFSSSTDLEFPEYNSSNTPALGRFG